MFAKQALVSSMALLAGCTVIPTVQYRFISKDANLEGLTDTFYRDSSELNISLSNKPIKSDENNGADTKREYTVVARRAPFLPEKIGIRAIKNWRSSTLISINKVDNTDLVASIGVQVENEVVKTVNAFGGAIVSLIGIAGADVSSPGCISPDAPITIPLSEGFSKPIKFSANGVADCIQITSYPLPPDAIAATSIPQDTDSNYYYYSACRDISVTIRDFNNKFVTTRLRVADPYFVQRVQFPAKGTITIHSVCGASVKVDANASNEGAAIVGALATQAKAIKDAIDAAKKD